MAFPTTPANGDTHTVGSVTWSYNSTTDIWAQANTSGSGGGATTLTDLGITDGTNGQVLTTDGSGGFTFTTVGGSNAGDVGTYIFAGRNAVGGITQNSTYAGSTLISSGFASVSAYNDDTAATINGNALSGTWKAMGNVSITSRRASTLFLRIS